MENLLNFGWMTNPGAWIGLLTLVALEIVLGIDTIVFISILSGKLPPEQQAQGRKTGMVLAVIPRIVLLLFIPLILSFEKGILPLPFLDPDPHAKQKMLSLSIQDLIVLIGGMFLLYKATHEIHHKLEGDDHIEADPSQRKSGTVAQNLTAPSVPVVKPEEAKPGVVTPAQVNSSGSNK